MSDEASALLQRLTTLGLWATFTVLSVLAAHHFDGRRQEHYSVFCWIGAVLAGLLALMSVASVGEALTRLND